MQINSGMTAEGRQLIGEKLSRLLADLYTLYVQTQSAHWNLTGNEFYSLHLLLEKQYQALAETIDETAERVRALGLYVDSSLAGFLSKTTLHEVREVMAIPQLLQHLLTNQEAAIRHGRQVGILAEEQTDHATVDFIGRLLNMLEKFSWMVRSQLHP